MQATQWRNRPRVPLADRLFAKLEPTPTGCLEFAGKRNRQGYGYLSLGPRENRKYIRAHRLAWELNNGPIPEGLDLCHRCDNPPCCNPEHLFPGTRLDNMRDMAQKGRGRNANRTHCKRGHEYTPENTYLRTDGSGGARRCKTCRTEDSRRQRKLAA